MRSRQAWYSWCVKTKKTNRRRAQRKQSQHKAERRYRLRNWKQYNKALRQRGDLNFWVDEEALKSWYCAKKTGKRGAPRLYQDSTIHCALTLQALFHLPLRATQGFLESVFRYMNLEFDVPDYTTLSRRRETLEMVIPRRRSGEGVHLVVDSTGFKVYGEGEWKVRQHGWSKRRTWRKLHLGIDEASGEILAAMVTTPATADSQVLEDLLHQVDDAGCRLEQVSGDGGYDARNCYDAIRERGARATIPPRKGAKIWQHGNSSKERHIRDENIRDIRKVGRKKWKQESGYHRRSLAETAIFRLKTIFGGELSPRKFDGQAVELFVRCGALDKMATLGMPDSYLA